MPIIDQCQKHQNHNINLTHFGPLTANSIPDKKINFNIFIPPGDKLVHLLNKSITNLSLV
jgi:hypothetical protein